MRRGGAVGKSFRVACVAEVAFNFFERIACTRRFPCARLLPFGALKNFSFGGFCVWILATPTFSGSEGQGRKTMHKIIFYARIVQGCGRANVARRFLSLVS